MSKRLGVRGSNLWQQPTPTESGTAVFCSLGTANSQDRAAFQELWSVLRGQCLYASSELLVSTRQRTGGVEEHSILTSHPSAQVSAIVARIVRRYPDFNVAVASVKPQMYGTIKQRFSTRKG